MGEAGGNLQAAPRDPEPPTNIGGERMNARDTNTITQLATGIRCVAKIIQARLPGAPTEAPEGARCAWESFESSLRDAPDASPLAELATRLMLGAIDLQCILLALVRHVDPGTAEDFDPGQLTVASAVRMLLPEGPERAVAADALGPTGKLLRYGLLMLGGSGVGGRASSPIALTAPALRYLLQDADLSPSVARFARLVHPRSSLVHVVAERRQLDVVRELVQEHVRFRNIVGSWGLDELIPYGRGLTVLISGPAGTGKTLLTHALGTLSRRPLLVVSAADLQDRDGLDTALGDLFSEATVRDTVVVLDDCENLLGRADPRRVPLLRAMEEFEGITVLCTSQPEQLAQSVDRIVSYEVRLELPAAEQRRHIWDLHLPPGMPLGDDVELDALADTYDFTGAGIKNAVLVAVHRALAEAPATPVVRMSHLVEGCQSQIGSALEDLTVRTRSPLRLRDVVLPEEPREKIREIVAAIRNQVRVLNQWGFSERLVTGKGITVLFDGPPGTGKTLCAEVIAGELDRPIHRVNIPEVVSKWVGETEKNIREIFQAARVSKAMLLFDEADSLFGARSSETKSATDRHANMEVNLLLQEIERFPGVCFLTTNFFGALDGALLRRIQFRVTFQEPSAEERSRIWATLCPQRVPLATDVSFDELGAVYELTGGLIKNALLRAAYRAADKESAVTQEILRQSCEDEYAAAGKISRRPAAGNTTGSRG